MEIESIYFFIEKNLKSDSVIFEIGVHIGTDSEKIYDLTGSEHLYGFEPDPRNIKILEERNRIRIFKEFSGVALSDTNGISNFYLSSGTPPELYEDPDMNKDWSASSSLKKPKKHLDVHKWCKFNFYERVKTIRFDDFCKERNIEFIDFVWMDVQGAEDLVIKGMGDMKDRIKYLYTEYSECQLYDGSLGKEEILNKLGSSWEIIKDFGNDILLKNNKYENQ